MLRGTFLSDELKGREEQRKINVWEFIKLLSLQMLLRPLSGGRRDQRRHSEGAVNAKMILAKLKNEWVEG
jgi:hypothetical protein